MSSSPDREDESASAAKKRKILRACDYCRRKKIKCDGPQQPDNRCSKCVSRSTECTYVDPLHKNFFPASYVGKLESRIQKLERLLKKLNPDVDLAKELDAMSDQEGVAREPPSKRSEANASTLGPRTTSSTTSLSPPIAPRPSSPVGSDNLDSSEEESELKTHVTESFKTLSIDPITYRYHGKSSGLIFLRAAKGLKDQSEQVEPHHDSSRAISNIRMSGYHPHPWLKSSLEDSIPPFPFEDFPPHDLIDDLIDLYFRNFNDYWPLLHEPTFKQSIEEGWHLMHGGFGATVLLVCANGARFSRDPRVLLDNVQHPRSAGWKYYQQVEDARKSLLAPVQLHDLQICVLKVQFLQGTTVPHAAWTHISTGIRLGVEVGAHRKKMYGETPTVEEESMRRAFWVLVCHDWGVAYALGRPCSIHDEDMDLDLPMDCDDQYWLTIEGERFFEQPTGKPSKVSFFNCYIRLIRILAFALRTIYSINKSKSKLGQGDGQWERRIVAELDSALNEWADSVPAHLKWDPNREDTLFLKQSATLFSHYYQFQIAVHRPFISTRRQSPLSFTSVIICTNAARSVVRVVYSLCQRTGTPMHKNVSSLFISAVILLLNVWSEKRSGRSVNADRDIEDVRKCMEMIKTTVQEMHVGDRLWDILNELVSAEAPVGSQAIPKKDTPGLGPTTTSSDLHSSASSYHTPSAETPNAPSSHQDAPMDGPRGGVLTATAAGSSSLAHALLPQQAVAQPGGFATWDVSAFGSSGDLGTSFVLPRDTGELSPPMANEFIRTSSAPSALWQEQLQDAPTSTTSMYQHLHDPQYATYQQGSSTSADALSAGTAPNQFGGSGGTTYSFDHFTTNTSTIEPAQSAMEGTMPELTFVDDTLSTWSNAPSFFGWDDWGSFLSNVNSTNRSAA